MEWLGGGGKGGQDLALGPGEGGLYGVKGGSGGLRKGWQGWDGVLVWLQSVPPDLAFSPPHPRFADPSKAYEDRWQAGFLPSGSLTQWAILEGLKASPGMRLPLYDLGPPVS